MESKDSQEFFLGRVTTGTIRVVLIGGGIVWCLQITLPFLVPVLWGAIIATAAYPLVHRLAGRHPAIGAAVFGAVALLVIAIPTYLFFDSVGSFVVRIGRELSQGQLKLPAPDPKVAEWPIVGKRVFGIWTSAVDTPASVIEAHLPQLRGVGRWLALSLGTLTLGLLQMLFAIAVAVAFLTRADATHRALLPIAERLAPQRGQHLLDLAGSTVRAVAKGVLGVAAIQAALAWIGMAVAGVPAPAAWALLVLIAAVAQLPSLLVLAPIVVYVFASSPMHVAIAYLVWSVVLGLLDNVLKPILLGRGAGVPSLVIVIGALGGMISSGIIGLFVGAVVLGVGYELFVAWVKGSADELALETRALRTESAAPSSTRATQAPA